MPSNSNTTTGSTTGKADNKSAFSHKQKPLDILNRSASLEKGSGSDKNSDHGRLKNTENRFDKMDEDSFPASDAPSQTGRSGSLGSPAQVASGEMSSAKAALKESGLPADFKDSKMAQFEYGRKSEASTLHFDTSTRRLEMGNPDIGNVDLGTIDNSDESEDAAVQKADRRTDKAEKRADLDRQNED